MVREVISLNGAEFEIEYEGYLTDIERNRIITNLRNGTSMNSMDGCNTCGRGIKGLATCPTSSKNVGDIVSMSSQPNTGTAPYTVSFFKGTTLLQTFNNVSENQLVSYSYTIVSSDAGTTQSFNVNTTDSCSGGTKTCSESCNVVISSLPTPSPSPSPTPSPSITVNIPGCPLNVTSGVGITLPFTISGGTSPYTVKMYTDNVLQQTLTGVTCTSCQLNNLTFTGSGTHIFRLDVTDSASGSARSNDCTVNISVSTPSPSPSPGNLLLNPGFEFQYSPGFANYWGLVWTTGISPNPVSTKEIGREGGLSIAMSVQTASLGKYVMYRQDVSGIDSLKTYKLSGYIKTENVTSLSGKGGAILDAYLFSSSSLDVPQIGTQDWTYHEVIIKPNIGRTSISVGIKFLECSGKVYFDDMSLTEYVSTPSPSPTPGPSPSPTPPLCGIPQCNLTVV